jgi:hypothetical protein
MKNFFLLPALIFAGCQMQSKHAPVSQNAPLVDPKYSVAKDRSTLDDLREDIPVPLRKENDEKALIADLTTELKYPPEVVREKYAGIVRKKRDLFNKDMQKQRDEYNKAEKRTRDDFLKSLEEERKDFLSRKESREARTEFFNQIDEKRRDFFSAQKDKREEFESDFREKRKNFEDYVKERNDTFNEELKDYSARWKTRQDAENQ